YVPEASATRRPPPVQLTLARVAQVGGLAQTNSPLPASMVHSTPLPLNASIAFPCCPGMVAKRRRSDDPTPTAVPCIPVAYATQTPSAVAASLGPPRSPP